MNVKITSHLQKLPPSHTLESIAVNTVFSKYQEDDDRCLPDCFYMKVAKTDENGLTKVVCLVGAYGILGWHNPATPVYPIDAELILKGWL
jgi:hypothetical protein